MKSFVSQLRYTLQNLQDKNGYLGHNVELHASTKINHYNYVSNVAGVNPHNLYEYSSSLSKDGKAIMSFEQFETEVRNSNYAIDITEQEREIIEYGDKLFSLLTCNGRYYRPETDLKIIENIVCEKYSLQRDEFLAIYEKALVFKQ
ncbi:MAG: hypothetical protein ACI4XL_13530 [Bacillus sp. (in: firmicutes)]